MYFLPLTVGGTQNKIRSLSSHHKCVPPRKFHVEKPMHDKTNMIELIEDLMSIAPHCLPDSFLTRQIDPDNNYCRIPTYRCEYNTLLRNQQLLYDMYC